MNEGAREQTPPSPAGSQHADQPNRAECMLCGAEMIGVHCKLICPNCGCKEDCSDLFPAE